MTDTKYNPATAGQDSDDLIAELARLVAQDARTAAGPTSAYKRDEPAFRQEPQVEAPAEPAMPEQEDFHEAEASFGAPEGHHSENPGEPEDRFEPERESGQSDAMPVFDFGFGTAQQTGVPEQTASGDPIADLIADAEVEAYDRDYSQDDDWAEHDDPLPAEPEAGPVSYEGYGRAEDEFSSAGEMASDQERDPLGDIEALIGEAARANSSDGGLPAGRRVRSSFLDDGETDAAVDAAESAILAAAAATGASVRRVEPASDPEDWLVAPAPRQAQPREEPAFEPGQPTPEQVIPDPLFGASAPSDNAPAEDGQPLDYADDGYGDEGYATEEMAQRHPYRRRFGGFIVPVAAGAVILALIGGVYFAFFSGPVDPGEAPVLTADASPLKEEAAPTPNDSAASDSVVFSEIEGNGASPEDEELVSRDQTDGASGAQVAEALAPEEGETALANRPVRTVTVRPDGTIVQADDSVAGSNVLPVERPDVPAVPNSTLTSDPIGEAIAQAIGQDESAAGADAATPTSVADVGETVPDASTPETADSSEAAPTTTTTTDDPGAPVPVARPAGLTAQTSAASTPTPATTAPATETVAAVTPAPAETAPAASAATPSSNVGAWVQLSSQRSEADALADIPALQSRYGSLFNGAEPEVSRVDLGERGIYYRVRLPQPSFDQANSVCTAIQGQGGDCFVLNN
ncbi:SPOR domain-containing protein [Pelagibacterium halotolerans]|uniref:SPOR domain-containing protein n=1 Tax=Pelagibacterium halotolerans (strain DSM 22347 / JCM 15775 / CGMCC 1.7692 / B2) TaxID=1082931 RepID=G4R9T8_PELHB|nr:SPOR domain-containing protein [Pelagibacterium halotolerans]AEQ51499.1 hypothetical protein KKY_1479 [Pelagibacterium halotolerans B2]QJR18662.1 SPOR domain-containing protein [Pelagibacterium halotolerans]SEA15236.1 Sporulation related domain-containing protein [Pelagibacterium halotolerans]